MKSTTTAAHHVFVPKKKASPETKPTYGHLLVGAGLSSLALWAAIIGAIKLAAGV